jgi:hypothetical protein
MEEYDRWAGGRSVGSQPEDFVLLFSSVSSSGRRNTDLKMPLAFSQSISTIFT